MNELREIQAQREILWQQIRDQLAQAGYSTETARWLIGEVIGPMGPDEGPRLATKVGNDGMHVVFPYRERLRFQVREYLAMSEKDRNLLHAGVEDGVKWRGEPMRQYVDIVAETLKMRDIGRDRYIAATKERIAPIHRRRRISQQRTLDSEVTR